MLDIGGWEFLVVAFVLIMVVGPKELPRMLRSFTQFSRSMRKMAREFTDGMNQICLLYTSPSPRDRTRSRMPSSA